VKYAEDLIELLALHGDAGRAEGMSAYMRNQFTFIGIMTVPRRSMLASYVKEKGLPRAEEFDALVRELWLCEFRELNYCAIELFIRMKWYKKQDSIDLIEWMIINKSWWDTVDTIAANLCGKYFKHHPDQVEAVTSQWNSSENIWLVRSSIIYQLKYGSSTDLKQLTHYIVPHLGSSEFFIQKAIGWALRQVSKWNAPFVVQFIKLYPLKPVSLREARKYV
jgi:3-methyladenine DNA glycosylase AlkD